MSDRDDDAQAWADETPKYRHRCQWPDYYGCSVCMRLSDDDEPEEEE